ncbi:MAG: type II toxin-antitoxin system VapC family toxin [Ginsengibacter sp.]
MGKVIVDTNILIYLLKKDFLLGELLDHKKVYISYITELELLSFPKLTAQETALIHDLLYNCNIILYSDDLKEKIILLRKKYSLSLPDAIIAATALSYFMPLLTADKQFAKIQEIETSIYITH